MKLCSTTIVSALIVSFAAGCGSEGAGSGGAGSKDSQWSAKIPGYQKPLSDLFASDAPAFIDLAAKLAAEAERAGKPVIPGAGDGEWLLAKDLRSIGVGEFWGAAAAKVSRATKDDRKDPLPAILDFHKQMEEAGIDWVFVPVPSKVVVDPTVLPGAPEFDKGRIDKHHVVFYDHLREQGVPVLDLVPELRKLVADGKRAHCLTDTHWTSLACEVAARMVHDVYGGADWAKGSASYGVRRAQKTVDGDMKGMGATAPSEALELAYVDSADGKPVPTSRQSPILLMGDSHCLVYHAGGDMLAEGAGFADHLAAHFKQPVDVLGVRGSGATPARVDLVRDRRAEGKKLVVWCLSARDFSEAQQGWRKLPVFKK